MEDNWRYAAKSVTKYDPFFRDENGHYAKNEWIGFFQIGKVFDDGVLTFESYLKIEQKYIQAAIWFFEFHECDKIILRDIEKYDFSEYKYEDREELMLFYNDIDEHHTIAIKDLDKLVKLILRELLWSESFCNSSDEIALRFGYDFYMYFNSNKNMEDLFAKIKEMGLYVY